MSRRGFALLAVLWVLTALVVLAGAGFAVARTGSLTTRNRVLLARAGWAREACVEILLARYAQDAAIRRLDPVDLGRGSWCAAALEDPAARLNPNLADRDALLTLLSTVCHRRSVDSLADVAELRYVPGFDSALVARLSAFLTTRGTGVINVNAAPREVLATLPGITEEAILALLGRRLSGRPIQNADELAALVSRSARSALLANYPEFVRAATFAPAQLVAQVEGGVRGTTIVAQATLTLVPVPGRLAVIRRETE